MAVIQIPNHFIINANAEDDDLPAFTEGHFPVTYRYVFADESGILSDYAEYVADLHDPVDITDPYHGTTYRIGLMFMPSIWNSVAKLKIYRKIAGADNFLFVGEIKDNDEGVFVDYNTPSTETMPCTTPLQIQYESSFRWSDKSKPHHIRLANVRTVFDGDGDRITGSALLYGNLIVFKENSIHRFALQGEGDNPLSRYDIISPDIGCIAPRTIISVENTVYFLSWQGWYSFNNNSLTPVDENVHDEIRKILHDIDQYGNRVNPVQKATAGYNSVFNEIYLNLPRDLTGTDESRVFVYSLKVKYTTKFRYMKNPDFPNEIEGRMLRLYYTNSIGELRSADTICVYGTNDGFYPSPRLLVPAAAYIEAPTETYRDEVLAENWTVYMDGSERGILIAAFLAAKHFAGSGNYVSKIRKLNMLLPRVEEATIRLLTMTKDFSGIGIEDEWLQQQFVFAAGIGNLISVIPNTPFESVAGNAWLNSQQWNDLYSKSMRFSFEVDTLGRAELLAYTLYSRVIRSYLL